jgi:hypothetical protein
MHATFSSLRIYVFFFCLVLLCSFLCMFASASVYAQSTLPIASTVSIAGENLGVGTVIAFDQEDRAYRTTRTYNDAEAYGVIAERPALLFTTASGSVPVVHEGRAYVRVMGSTTPLARGDLLIASAEVGVATIASVDDRNVFAIALESFTEQGEGLILADIGVARAKEAFFARGEAASITSVEEDDSPLPVSFIRGAIAAVIAVGALVFMLFSFRSIVNNGVVSVGRNPRAQTSIVTFAFGTVLGVVLLGALALFVAVAVLVLPV